MKAMTMAAAALTGLAAFGWEYDKVDKVDLDPLDVSVSLWKGAAPQKPHRVLLFTDCYGYNHHGGRCYGEYVFKLHFVNSKTKADVWLCYFIGRGRL